MGENVVCTVRAKKLFVSNTSLHNNNDDHIDGTIFLRSLSDVDYLFEFSTMIQAENVKVALEDVTIIDEQILRILANDEIFFFSITNNMEYSILDDAIRQCRLTADLAFRIDCLVRDRYFAGIYSASLTERNDINLCEEIQILRNQHEPSKDFKVYDISVENLQMAMPKICGVPEDGIMYEEISKLTCIFCGTQKTMDITQKFVLHPYVPLNSERRNLYMCHPCITNWKIYREKAVDDNQIVIKDELNEELCGICSDTPLELVMCSLCPRSFCSTCLTHVLTPREIKALDNPSDWMCMCCKHGISASSPSLLSKDWVEALPRNFTTPHKSTKSPEKERKRTKCTQFQPNGATQKLLTAEKVGIAKISHKPKNIANWSRTDKHLEKYSSTDPGPVGSRNTGKRMSLAASTPHTDTKSRKNGKSTDHRKKRCPTNGKTSVPTCKPCNLYLNRTEKGKSSSGTHSNIKKMRNFEELIDGSDLPPVCPVSDEMYYFKQFLEVKDDVCFLCKDGGELMECDYIHKDVAWKRRCQKVYHPYCLTFQVDSSEKCWRCPRHFCDTCSSTKLKYVCMYCPMSSCAACSDPMTGKVEWSQRSLSLGVKFTDTTTSVVCNSCLEMRDKCLAQQQQERHQQQQQEQQQQQQQEQQERQEEKEKDDQEQESSVRGHNSSSSSSSSYLGNSAGQLNTTPPSPSPSTPSSPEQGSPSSSSISSMAQSCTLNNLHMKSNMAIMDYQIKSFGTPGLPKKPNKSKNDAGMVIKLSNAVKEEIQTAKIIGTSKKKEHAIEVARSPQQRASVSNHAPSPQEILVLRLGQYRSTDPEPSDSTEWVEGRRRNPSLLESESRTGKRTRSADSA